MIRVSQSLSRNPGRALVENAVSVEIAYYDCTWHARHSVYNKFKNIMTFLKVNGICGLVTKRDWPRYTEEEPEMYEALVEPALWPAQHSGRVLPWRCSLKHV